MKNKHVYNRLVKTAVSIIDIPTDVYIGAGMTAGGTLGYLFGPEKHKGMRLLSTLLGAAAGGTATATYKYIKDNL